MTNLYHYNNFVSQIICFEPRIHFSPKNNLINSDEGVTDQLFKANYTYNNGSNTNNGVIQNRKQDCNGTNKSTRQT